MKRTAFIFGIATALLVGNIAHADYYRWTDENGVPRYSETPPTGIKAEKVKSNGSIAGEYNPDNQEGKPKDAQQELQKQQEHAKQVEDKQKKEAEALAAKCQTAQQQQQTLSEKHRIRVKKPDGTEGWLTEEERLAKVAEIDNFIKTSCQGK